MHEYCTYIYIVNCLLRSRRQLVATGRWCLYLPGDSPSYKGHAKRSITYQVSYFVPQCIGHLLLREETGTLVQAVPGISYLGYLSYLKMGAFYILCVFSSHETVLLLVHVYTNFSMTTPSTLKCLLHTSRLCSVWYVPKYTGGI